jgi:Ni/Co efflux regulator RcnB
MRHVLARHRAVVSRVEICQLRWRGTALPGKARQQDTKQETDNMRSSKTIVLGLAVGLLEAGSLTMAEPPHADAHAAPARGEPHPAPKGYARVTQPKGWNACPAAAFDKHTYQHNFQAARSFKIGPHQRPVGWAAHHWGYGEILPRAYFTSDYLSADYWLFALEVPPAGYEWVRDDTDALLIDTNTGEILQVE